MKRAWLVAALCAAGAVAFHAPPAGYINVTQAPCNLDNTGTTDVTAALQACIKLAYSYAIPSLPLFFPAGNYLVSDTIVLAQDNPGPDDGINVVPGRFLPLIFIGATTSLPDRPTFVLAPNSPGFDTGSGNNYKPVVHIYSTGGEGVDMNNLFKGINFDLTAPGNPSAVAISHAGAQGATVTDVTVTAGPDTFACFAGLNGAGGAHSNIACTGGRYGLWVDDSQPVPVVVGAQLINQSVSAINYFSQETLTITGLSIVVPPYATGPAITTSNQGMSLHDVQIVCAGDGSNKTAIQTSRSLYVHNAYVQGCGTVIAGQAGMPPLSLNGTCNTQTTAWLHISEWAKGVDISPYYHANVVYTPSGAGGTPIRADGGNISQVDCIPTGTPGGGPPADLLSRHLWDEASFPALDRGDTADARRDCGAVGDNVTDDTAALQACLTAHARVFLPPGLYRISATLTMQPGGALVGMGNCASYIVAVTTGFPAASPSSPQPLLRTDTDSGAGASPTILAFVGLATWAHVPDVYTLDWCSQHPLSLWRVNYEHRSTECLWMSAYQSLSPTIIPCQLPVNLTIPKTMFRGLGRVHSFVNDDTGGILNTGAKYRHVVVANTTGFASDTAKLRFYSLNLEHAQSEANGEIRNASHVSVYSIKGEGNTPLLWIRGDSANVSVTGLGGGITPFPYNFTSPPDFEQATAGIFRVDAGAAGLTFAALLDHGYGAQAPYWPPNGGGCSWGRHYPYPGTAIPFYPYSTYPNVSMWNCWFGERVATAYWYMISYGNSGNGSTPMDKPIYWAN